jgi:2-keto-4-pentenoate hydratase/2-oxohepta-3-ene-1,7-dioic acid hydratase in catechol pathway
VKPGALDQGALRRSSVPKKWVRPEAQGEYRLIPSGEWLGDVDPLNALTFVGYRAGPRKTIFCLIMVCDPDQDLLVLLPLANGKTPLEVVNSVGERKRMRQLVADYQNSHLDASHRVKLIRLSLRWAIAKRKLGPPLPKPRFIFAVAANMPSHLIYDLALEDKELLRAFSKTRARVFLKYPPVPPPAGSSRVPPSLTGIVGPFDGIEYPAKINIPLGDEERSQTQAETRLDYEVEIGAVIGKVLNWERVEKASDAELLSAVAGYVLVSDVKARNPQVMGKIIELDRPYPRTPSPYLTGDEPVDRAIGFWDEHICRWWSYAASWGNYAAMGPFFAAAPEDAGFPARAVVSARSYGPRPPGSDSAPEKRRAGALYLRQCALVTTQTERPDRLIWDIPKIIRSILAPDSVLHFGEESAALRPGDTICLGTPGGVVITARPRPLLQVADKLLFWRDPLDWHDAFFDKDVSFYLHEGDEVFLWAEGLGFQRQTIRRRFDFYLD